MHYQDEMIQKRHYLTFLLAGLLTGTSIPAQKTKTLKWSVVATLPKVDSLVVNPGVAGAFSGVHNNVLIIAGGANFPAGMPWEGGKKMYQDQVYILNEIAGEKFEWFNEEKYTLKEPVAYGATVSSPEGIICIGGENDKGASANVFLIRWDKANKVLVTDDLPSLPYPLTNLSAVINDNKIFVAGGENINGVSDKFLFLDLKDRASGWKQLPSLPQPVSHAVMLVKSGKNTKTIYIIGGRRKTETGISELYKNVYEFDLRKNEWQQKGSLPFVLSAATGIVSQKNDLIILGGDKGETFHKVELLIAAIGSETNEAKKQELILQKNKIQVSHPGFSNEILCYNTANDKWSPAGVIPFPAAVTTTAVKWKNRIIIPSGEIKAGVRTAQVIMGKLFKK